MGKSNWLKKAVANTLLLVTLLTSCSTGGNTEKSGAEGSGEAVGTVRLEDDFYTAVNQEWLNNTELPSDFPMVQPMTELNDEISETLRADIEAMLQERPSDIAPEMNEFLNLYEMMKDMDTRNADGYEVLLPYLEKVESMNSLTDFNENLAFFIKNGFSLPFHAIVTSDMMNSEKNMIYFDSPSTLIPSPYYGTPTGDSLLEEKEKMTANFFVALGYSEEDAKKIAADEVVFDKLLVPLMKTPEEASVFTDMYHPIQFSEFVETYNAIDFRIAFTELAGENIGEVSVANQKYFDSLAEIVTEENFESMKSWMISGFAQAYSSFLPENFNKISFEYEKLMTGATEMTPVEESNYYSAKVFYSEPIGQYYGKKYFGEEAKADIETMVNHFITIYEKRIKDADWLSDATKEKAILKLENLIVEVGYPEKTHPKYSKLKVKTAADGGTLLENTIAFTETLMLDQFETLSKPVDRHEWLMSGDTVNAQSVAMKNAIYMPAGILQAPFYSLDQSDSENYGGIGVVIAHEISHVFDPNGAMYDEKGNMESWWTEEDYAAFEEKILVVTEQYEGLPFGGGKLNGSLSVTENVADLGGMAVSLEAMKVLPEQDYKVFFEAWAKCWAYKASPQVDMMLLEDVHAPNIYRVNTLLPNFDEFYEAFDIKEGDGMYREEEERVIVW